VGIGLATAKAFAAAGAAVVLVDINERGLRAATDELTSSESCAIGQSEDWGAPTRSPRRCSGSAALAQAS